MLWLFILSIDREVVVEGPGHDHDALSKVIVRVRRVLRQIVPLQFAVEGAVRSRLGVQWMIHKHLYILVGKGRTEHKLQSPAYQWRKKTNMSEIIHMI